MRHDTAIIGMSCRFPQAGNIDRFWENLASGKDSVRPFPGSRIKELEDVLLRKVDNNFVPGGYLEQVVGFEPGYFNISEEECRYMDPQQRLLLELVEEAIQDAGYNPVKLAGREIGVFMAGSKNVYGSLLNSSPMGMVNSTEAAMAARVAYTFDFHGPVVTVDTTCSSSLTALHYALLSLESGQCEFALVGGSNIDLLPQAKEMLEGAIITSGTGKARAFAKGADGTVPGEGGGVLFLRPRKDALENKDTLHAVIRASGLNSNGRRSNGLNAPSQCAQTQLISKVVDSSGVDPLQISYVETHGTGTKLGDPIEAAGLTEAFSKYSDKKQYLAIGSVKTNIGHLDGAAGMAGAIKAVLALKNKQVPKSLHFDEPNPHIDFKNSPLYVADDLLEWKQEGTRLAGVTSLGLTGTNAFTLLEEAPQMQQGVGETVREKNELFTLSARTEASFREIIDNLSAFLEKNNGGSLQDIAYTLNTGRRHLQYRAAFTAAHKEQLLEKLGRLKKMTGTPGTIEVNGIVKGIVPTKKSFMPAFIFTAPDGNGNSRFARVPGNSLFRRHYQEFMQEADQWEDYRFYAFQYAFARYLTACGLSPKAVLGISNAAFVADAVKGKISLSQCIESIKKTGGANEFPDEEKLKKVIRQMMDKGYGLFFSFGKTNPISDTIGEIVAAGEGIHYFHLDGSEDSLFNALSRLYAAGADLEWEPIYSGGQCARVNLPAYPFHRKPYYLEGKNLDIGLETSPASAAEPEPAEEPSQRKAVADEDVLDIIKSVIPYDIDLEWDFEENGGDSVSVMEAVEILKKRYRTTVPVDLFYTVPTLRELVGKILNLLNNPGKEAASTLSPVSSREPSHAARAAGTVPTGEQPPAFDASAISGETIMPENILLTGATGFLGAHLLQHLLLRTKAHVYCLVRAETRDSAVLKCLKKLNFYFDDQPDRYLDKRLFIVTGDITVPCLGMAGEDYERLSGLVDTVVHSAADVRHHGKYERFETVNVSGTANIIDFCSLGRKKRLHHISTLAVAGEHFRRFTFSENHLEAGQSFNGHVYGKSKFEAEKLVNEARQKGLEAVVYRVGNLTGRREDGIFQENIGDNLLYNNIKALLTLGRIPRSYLDEERIEMTPVDTGCLSILNIMLLKDSAGYNFHIMNPRLLPVKDFVDYLRRMDYTVEAVEDPDFYDYVRSHVEDKGFVKEISTIFSSLRSANDADVPQPVNVVYDSAFTVDVLGKTGFNWQPLDYAYINRILKYAGNVEMSLEK